MKVKPFKSRRIYLKFMVILKSLQAIHFFLRMAYTQVFFTRILLFCPFLNTLSFLDFSYVVSRKQLWLYHQRKLPYYYCSLLTQTTELACPARRTSQLPGSSSGLNLKFGRFNFERFFTILFNGEHPYYVTDYILTVKLLKFHLYSKSFVEKAMVLPYSSERTPYVRIIDILPNI